MKSIWWQPLSRPSATTSRVAKASLSSRKRTIRPRRLSTQGGSWASKQNTSRSRSVRPKNRPSASFSHRARPTRKRPSREATRWLNSAGSDPDDIEGDADARHRAARGCRAMGEGRREQNQPARPRSHLTPPSRWRGAVADRDQAELELAGFGRVARALDVVDATRQPGRMQVPILERSRVEHERPELQHDRLARVAA